MRGEGRLPSCGAEGQSGFFGAAQGACLTPNAVPGVYAPGHGELLYSLKVLIPFTRERIVGTLHQSSKFLSVFGRKQTGHTGMVWPRSGRFNGAMLPRR